MIYDVIYSAQAKNDLVEIIEFYRVNANNENYAKYLKDTIESKVKNLNMFPERYKRYPFPKNNNNIRIMFVEYHNIFFLVNKKTSQIIVLRILHCARNNNLHF